MREFEILFWRNNSCLQLFSGLSCHFWGEHQELRSMSFGVARVILIFRATGGMKQDACKVISSQLYDCKAPQKLESGIGWPIDWLQICKLDIILLSENMTITSLQISAFQQKSKNAYKKSHIHSWYCWSLIVSCILLFVVSYMSQKIRMGNTTWRHGYWRKILNEDCSFH